MEFLEQIKSNKSSIGQKYRAFFELKHLNRVDLLLQSFDYLGKSEYLRHEVVYTMGQMEANPQVIQFLINLVQDENEQVVVRHEAAEALGNYKPEQTITNVLQKYQDSQIEEVKDTCILAYQKHITFEQKKDLYGQKYSGTIEPSAPFNKEDVQQRLQTIDYDKIFEYIINDNTKLYDKYSMMYFLRNEENKQSIKTLIKLLDPKLRTKTGVLLRHEVCFIMGCIGEQAKEITQQLLDCQNDKSENSIVRHEAISAYSSISDDKNILKLYLNDEQDIVRESCEVAIENINYWNNE